MTATMTKQEIPAPLSQKPGIQLIKNGTPGMVDLETTYMCPGLKSTIIDVPISSEMNQLDDGAF